ncbi:MAG: glycosyltransferase, partial [Candidatus Nitrosotenuis sp.]
GDANLKIHIVGKTTLLNLKSKRKQVANLIRTINPDILRAYNPLLQGWLAVKTGKELGIPVVLSLAGDYDRDVRYFAKKNKDIKMYLKLIYTRKFLESYSIKNANAVVIIYEFVRKYAQDMGARDIHLIYNRIDLSQFSAKVEPIFEETKPVVLCVGRLMSEKNQECLIRAIKDLDVKLLLIGDGPQFEELTKLVKELKIEKKVRFERKIPHNDIHRYYASADIFALPIKYGGFAIPVLEAAASGLPVILPKQEFETNPELIKDFALLVDNNPESFKKAIQKVLDEKDTRIAMINSGLEIVKKINSEIMEQKEKDLYLSLIQKS